MGRTIKTQRGKAKWYDLPLTEQEIERGNAIGELLWHLPYVAVEEGVETFGVLLPYGRSFKMDKVFACG